MTQPARVVLTAPAFIKGWLIATTLWVGVLFLVVAFGYGVPTLLSGTDAGHLWGVAGMVLLYGYGIALVFAAPLAWVLAYLLRPVSKQWIHVAAFFLVPALLRRIRRRKLRYAAAWTTGLAAAAAVPYLALFLFFAILTAAIASDYVRVDASGGQSVLITQDHFDGHSVDIYTRHDDTHYRRNRSAPELAGWPRVKDQNCRLAAVGDELQLTCSSGTVVISQGR